MKKLSALFLVGYILSGGVAHAATYYVSGSGSNNNSCAQAQSLSTPRATVNSGLSCLSPGDTLLVRGGSYNEGIYSSPSGTSWSNKIRIANYSGETVWLKPLTNANGAAGTGRVIWFDGNISFVEFDGINLDGSSLSGTECVLWASTNNNYNPHHIRFQNAEVIAGAIGSSAAICLGGHAKIGATGSNEVINVKIHGGGLSGSCGFECSSYGVYIAGPNNLVQGCDIYDTSGMGIQIYNYTGDAPDNNILRQNRIHDISRTGSPDQVFGILVAGSNNQVYNNVIYGITAGNVNSINSGIYLYNGFSGNKIWSNTIYNKIKSGIVVGSSSNSEIRNNIVYMTSGQTYIDQGTGTVQSNNLFGVNPLFVEGYANNLRLQAGSPAVNAGANLSAVTTDMDGVVRPQGSAQDIGAYEYHSAAPVTPVTPPATPVNYTIVAK